MKKIYGHDFYMDRHQKTVYSARTVLSLVLDALPPVHSAIDFGCGVGTWLSVLKEKGVNDIRGLDGPWVEQNLLEIPIENFQQVDFKETIGLKKKYDLAITLEVAEHLPHESASSFVESLINASDFILFSAAIPYQDGRGHLNEQWPDYWADIFNARGYIALDFVRKEIWNDKKIPAWYRQNILIFVKEDQIQNIRDIGLVEFLNPLPISLVHPDLYLSISQRSSSVGGSLRLFLKALMRYFKRM